MTSTFFKVALLAAFLGLTYAVDTTSVGSSSTSTTRTSTSTASTTTTAHGVTQCYVCTSCSDKGVATTCKTSDSDTNKYACYRGGVSLGFLGSAYNKACYTVEQCSNSTTVEAGAVGVGVSSTCCYSDLCNFSLSQMKSSSMTTLLIIAFASIAIFFRSH